MKGETLREAIEAVDRETGRAAEYYMINCAHPTHFEDALQAGEAWTERIHGLRANASTKSHAELDESETLDAGDPADLGRRYLARRQRISEDAHSRRLLRHRPSPRRRDLRGLRVAAGTQLLTAVCDIGRLRHGSKKMAGIAPGHFHSIVSPQRGGAVPGGGGGSEACPPLSSGVMLRIVTRRLIALGPSVCSFRYCSP